MHRKYLTKKLEAAILIMGLVAAQPTFFASAETSVPKEKDGIQLVFAESDDAIAGDQKKGEQFHITMMTYQHDFKTKKGKVYKKISYEYPLANGDSAAVATFNNFFEKQQKKWVKSAKKNLDSAKQDVKEIESEAGTCYSDAVTCELVQNEKYISVLQTGYDYTLGAHGMPYRMSYLFTTDTGENVSAAKILGITKKELNNKVSKLFVNKYNKSKDSDKSPFFNSEVISAKETKKFLGKMDFSDCCYLKNGKLCFYADPYALGPYASGFIQVTMKL